VLSSRGGDFASMQRLLTARTQESEPVSWMRWYFPAGEPIATKFA
jgi:hypothetical protein